MGILCVVTIQLIEVSNNAGAAQQFPLIGQSLAELSGGYLPKWRCQKLPASLASLVAQRAASRSKYKNI